MVTYATRRTSINSYNYRAHVLWTWITRGWVAGCLYVCLCNRCVEQTPCMNMQIWLRISGCKHGVGNTLFKPLYNTYNVHTEYTTQTCIPAQVNRSCDGLLLAITIVDVLRRNAQVRLTSLKENKADHQSSSVHSKNVKSLHFPPKA